MGDVRQSDFRMTAQIAAYTSITAGAWRWEISRLRFASLEMTGRGRSRRSAIGYGLPAAGCWLSAFSFWLSAIGVPSAIPPSPLRGPLPPDKQWGAREYIGARHPPLDRGGQGRSADFWLPAAGCWILASGVPSAIPPRHCVALSPLTSSGAQESI